MKEFSAAGRSGTYLRIIEEGEVGAGDAIEAIHQPDHGVTVGMAFSARVGNGGSRAELMPALQHFAPKWQQWINASD
jgi:MOSC domain-containing protein YiiM